jgi:hypothetical protein
MGLLTALYNKVEFDTKNGEKKEKEREPIHTAC